MTPVGKLSSPDQGIELGVEDRVRAAERLVRGRELRGETFGVLNDAFGEPAWDMLLRLFIDDGRGVEPTVADLVRRSMYRDKGAKPDLAFLAIHRMVEIEGTDVADVALAAPDDRRVRLTDRGREMMGGYLAVEAAMTSSAESRTDAK